MDRDTMHQPDWRRRDEQDAITAAYVAAQITRDEYQQAYKLTELQPRSPTLQHDPDAPPDEFTHPGWQTPAPRRCWCHSGQVCQVCNPRVIDFYNSLRDLDTWQRPKKGD